MPKGLMNMAEWKSLQIKRNDKEKAKFNIVVKLRQWEQEKIRAAWGTLNEVKL